MLAIRALNILIEKAGQRRACDPVGVPRAAAPHTVELSAAARVLRRNLGWGTWGVREDYDAPGQVVSGYRRSMAAKHRAAVK